MHVKFRHMKKAVFIRLDKIGDLICTLPVDQVDDLRDWEITWIIAKGLSFVTDHSVPRRKYLELDKNDPATSKQRLEQFLKEFRPDVAISFQAPWWVNYLLWKNGVAQRIGVISKWHSLLFLNAGLRQKRSQSIKHEADYNLDLVRKITDASIHETTAPVLKLKADSFAELFSRYGLRTKGYVVVHPGMAGSALNWPIENYVELIEKLVLQIPVVLTGTAADEAWLRDIRLKFQNHPRVLNLQSQLNPAELLAVLAEAHSVYAPSTGVLHLAASLGTKVFGFYSPVQVQAAIRWGARGRQVHLFTPEVSCPAKHHCLREACPHYLCMRRISVSQILTEPL